MARTSNDAIRGTLRSRRRSFVRLILAAVAMQICVAAAGARPHVPPQQDYRGQWAGDGAHCKWPEEFLLVLDRAEIRIPYRSRLEPDRVCRILSVRSERPYWKLRLSCNHSDPDYRLPKPFETSLTARVSDDGYKMTLEIEPAFDQPARTEQLRYCRPPGENPPPLQCMDRDGKLIDCAP